MAPIGPHFGAGLGPQQGPQNASQFGYFESQLFDDTKNMAALLLYGVKKLKKGDRGLKGNMVPGLPGERTMLPIQFLVFFCTGEEKSQF